jgi:hypothetical protein
MEKITIKKSKNWKFYWGVMPLPKGATNHGLVTRNGQTGALICLESGLYVQGNAGGIRNLPQQEVKDALRASG